MSQYIKLNRASGICDLATFCCTCKITATSKTWTQTLDPESRPRKTWAHKNLDPKKPGP